MEIEEGIANRCICGRPVRFVGSSDVDEKDTILVGVATDTAYRSRIVSRMPMAGKLRFCYLRLDDSNRGCALE